MTGNVWNALAEKMLELGAATGDGTTTKPEHRHWRLAQDEDDIAWLILDQEGKSANTLGDEVLDELNACLREIENMGPKGLVIRSGKPGGFIAGADIASFKELTDESEVETRLRKAHDIVDRLEALAMPTIAVIHGYCLGGGLELALACDHRIAIDGAKLGFPEVMLGLHPGLGGTARSTALIDPTEAMTLMLTGKSAHTKKAKALGLVDAIVEERHVCNAVRAAIAGKIDAAEHGLRDSALSTSPARSLAARRMRAKTSEKAAEEHYPAPYRLINLWEEHGGDKDAMKAAEIGSFAKLLTSDTAQNLIRVFFLRESLKKQTGDARDFHHVHVIGAGSMGGDIAAWCALRGLTVTLGDMEAKPLAGAIKRAAKLGERSHLSSAEIRDLVDRLIPDLNGDGIARADVVIEAVPEKIEIKHKVYREIEGKLKKDAILATNTSSMPLEDLSGGLDDPGRLVGLHFFNPVARMELIEVVRHARMREETLAAAMAFAGRIDRLPAEVSSAPGFLVNRALTPYLLEAMLLREEGYTGETIDLAAERFGMPMGPIELADRVGLDICLHVADMLKEKLERPLADVPEALREKVEAGDLGQKTGRGLYRWKDDKPDKHGDPAKPADDMIDRLILPMVDACVACLREGVIENADRLDGAMIFGSGFAPFRGGPLHYAKARGVEDIVAALEKLAERHGERFKPDPGWEQLDR